MDEQLDLIKSKIVPDLKPTSVFNDYPYEVAVLVSGSYPANNIKVENVNSSDSNKISKNEVLVSNETIINLVTVGGNNPKITINEIMSNMTVPKRSSKYDYKTESSDRIQFVTDLNYTNENISRYTTQQNFSDQTNKSWHQNHPIPGVNQYKVMPKEPPKTKLINEKGLIKVISTLTKTFKKIMKQHNEIKTIHDKLQKINYDLSKEIADITKKFDDFDRKYANVMKLNKIIKDFEENLTLKEQNMKARQKEMTTNLIEFEKQQKTFLAQQKQFYAVQQLILAQNLKINVKQNLIAKTQSEISHRQNNFARILKKAKQIYTGSKNIKVAKIDAKVENNGTNTSQVTHIPTPIPPPSESIKINLFSVPTVNRIENQDDILIKEKDHQPIDDLVYKFYFNNTFIDNLMKSKVLNAMVSATESGESRNSIKNKRSELTTVLLPVNKSYIDIRSETFRNKRWIRHYSKKHNNKRKYHGKTVAAVVAIDKVLLKNSTKLANKFENNKTDPFLVMARSFCNEIHHNANAQALGWCIEKALRRLQYMDAKMAHIPSNKLVEVKIIKTKVKKDVTTKSSLQLVTDAKQPTIPVPIVTSTAATKSSVTNRPFSITELEQNTVFFPGNDELESNLKQYDLQPDPEGNVYYDDSLHTSELVGSKSEGYSDLMADMGSNFNMDLSPLAYNYNTGRQGYMLM